MPSNTQRATSGEWTSPTSKPCWNWRPGDRYQPIAAGGVQKIKQLFQEARIPLWERRNWPILLDGDSIVWVRRFGPAAQFAAGPETATILRIQEVDAS